VIKAPASKPPHLWHFRVSHYNEKVRWALDYKRWPHRRTSLVPGFHLPQVRSLTGQSQVPALELDGQMLLDSTHIIEELERRRPTPALMPSDPVARARAREIAGYFDREVAPALRRMFWDIYLKHPSLAARLSADGASDWARLGWLLSFPVISPAFRYNVGANARLLKLARRRISGYFDRLEERIGPSGYLVGERFGFADLSVAAVLSVLVRPPEFPYPLPQPLPPELVETQASLRHRAGYRWVEGIYARHRGASAEIAQDIGDD
jgi:glutathione S-transferase